MTHGDPSEERLPQIPYPRGLFTTGPSMDWTSDHHQPTQTYFPAAPYDLATHLSGSLLASQQSVQRLATFADLSLGVLSYGDRNGKQKMDYQNENNGQGDEKSSGGRFGVTHTSKLTLQFQNNLSPGELGLTCCITLRVSGV